MNKNHDDQNKDDKVWKKLPIIITSMCITLLLVGFTCMPMIVEMVNGRTIELDRNHLFTSGSANELVEVIDGRINFTFNNTDITEYCSDTTYFRYDYIDENNVSHVFLVGGQLDSLGWTEILFLENGKRISHSNITTEDGNPPVWYALGNEAVNKDYGYISQKNKSKNIYEIEIEAEKIGY